MPQCLQCKRVLKGKVEKNYTCSYPLGKRASFRVHPVIPESSSRNTPNHLIGFVFTLAYLLCMNGTVSEQCHKYPSTTFVREQLLGSEICRSRILL
ncbi:hypothetical protein NPIL_239871 [Nephila pilipes]|uniref:Uncharacterized protein n=1 Tax=Nephila pilipes TaxID=299642 RepID=A0A8X6TLV3_NEPPI|nr:hypothetical protein NPIL_239871 [Nephila pilipes]